MFPGIGAIAKTIKKPAVGRAFGDKSVAFANKSYNKPIKSPALKAFKTAPRPGQIKTAEDILYAIEKRANYEMEYGYQEPPKSSDIVSGAKIGGTAMGTLGVLGGTRMSKRIHRRAPHLHNAKTSLVQSIRGGLKGAAIGALVGGGTMAYLQNKETVNGLVQ